MAININDVIYGVTVDPMYMSGFWDPSSAQYPSQQIEGKVFISNGSGGVDPFCHFCDIHYQSTSIGTKNKAPGFYT